jgi:hypothetical protein
MSTERTPDQIAAELYPYDEEVFLDVIMSDAQRAAWLSRQPEVDELKRQVEESNTKINLQRQGLLELHRRIAAKEKVFKELVELWQPIYDFVRPHTKLGHSVNAKALEMLKTSFAKEKEVKRWKKSYQNLSEINAAKFEKIAELQAENERLGKAKL